jgi:hypothetical protein
VDLLVTVTTTSGVTRKLLSAADILGSGNCAPWMPDSFYPYYTDYILWSGSEAEYANLISIEAVVYQSGDDENFGGVMVGSGSGVYWEKED